MANHGVNVTEVATSLAAPTAAATGIPFFVGCAPIHSVDSPAPIGVPVLITSWDEFKEKLGYCEDWANFDLCECGYSQFVDFGMQPAIFVNVFDPSTMKSAQTAADFTVTDHKVNLGKLAINNSSLVVKDKSTPAVTLTKDTDYEVYFSNGEMIIELLSTGGYYSEATLSIAYDKAVFTSVNATLITGAVEKIELCMSTLGVIPDMIVVPNFSSNASVAAAMASKAAAINGLFRAKALVDVPCGSGDATVYSAVIAKKNALAMTDLNEIVCWPMCKLGDHKYHMSVRIAGLISAVDTENGAPHHSPSNNALKVDSLVIADGTEVLLTKAQADILNAGGVMTGLNFMGGYVAWGNYTGCYPTNTDVKDFMISVSRTFDWVANTLIQTFWGYLDTPMTRRLIDTILDTCNIWLNGLKGADVILGGRCEMIESENPVTNLTQGIVKLHIYLTPPSPAQEIDFTLEYDASYVTAALTA